MAKKPLGPLELEALTTLMEAPNLTAEHLEKLAESMRDFEQQRLLQSFALLKGYAYIKTNSLAQRDALEHFVTTELFLHYNEQSNHFII